MYVKSDSEVSLGLSGNGEEDDPQESVPEPTIDPIHETQDEHKRSSQGSVAGDKPEVNMFEGRAQEEMDTPEDGNR